MTTVSKIVGCTAALALCVAGGSTAEAGPPAASQSEAQAHALAGMAAMAAGNYEDAILELSAVQLLTPDDDRNVYNLALSYDHLGDAARAIQYYREFLGRAPTTNKRVELEARIASLSMALEAVGGGGGSAVAPVVTQAPGQVPMTQVGPKNPNVALGLSLGVTLGGLGLGLIGAENRYLREPLGIIGGWAFFLGPTVGHTYAGQTWNTGLSIRLAGLGVAVLGVVVAVGSCPISFSGSSPCSQAGVDIGAAIAIGGVITYLAGWAYEIATAPTAARDYNLNHGVVTTVTIAPILGAVTIGPGLAVVGSF
jgi:hypothetical protein